MLVEMGFVALMYGAFYINEQHWMEGNRRLRIENTRLRSLLWKGCPACGHCEVRND